MNSRLDTLLAFDLDYIWRLCIILIKFKLIIAWLVTNLMSSITTFIPRIGNHPEEEKRALLANKY